MRAAIRAAALAALAGLLMACAPAILPGTALPRAADTDPATLETGAYPREPVPFTPTRQMVTGFPPIQESQRMLSALVVPTEVDDSLNTAGGVQFYTYADGLSEPVGVLPAYQVPAADRNLFLLGLATVRTNGSLRAAKRLINMVLRFPDDNFARAAAADFARTMRDNVPGARDRPEALPQFPGANTVYADNSSSMTCYLARGPFVIIINAGLPTPDFAGLTAQIRKTLELQTARLATYRPTPLDDILDLPTNTAGLLDKALPVTSDSASLPPDERAIGVYPAAGAVNFERDAVAAASAFTDTGTDLVARRGAVVYRARDSWAAIRLQSALARMSDRNDQVIASPPGLPDTQCQAPYARAIDRPYRYFCVLSWGRYAAVVAAQTQRVVWLQAAAQYSILAKSPGQ